MTRIFATLALLSNLSLLVAFLLGLNIDDARSPDQTLVQYHFLTALGAIVFAMLVHSIVFTYFMGTGRWLEEASNAYKLSPQWRAENQRLKYRCLPGIVGCLLLLIVTGVFGAVADPASSVDFELWGMISSATVHFLIAAIALTANVFVSIYEFQAIFRNGQLVNQVLAEVRRIREEHGLAV